MHALCYESAIGGHVGYDGYDLHQRSGVSVTGCLFCRVSCLVPVVWHYVNFYAKKSAYPYVNVASDVTQTGVFCYRGHSMKNVIDLGCETCLVYRD